MKKNILTITIIIAVIIGLYLLTSQKSIEIKNSTSNADLILFWGEGCSHCEKVKEYIKDNQIDEKLKIKQEEVFQDKNNSEEFQKTIKDNCYDLISSEGIGVPVIFDVVTKKCYQGDNPIIDYLSEKTK